MKTSQFFFTFLFLPLIVAAQYIDRVPLRTVDGQLISIDSIVSQKRGTIIVFWETDNSECYSNLDNLQEAWISNIEGLGVDLIAVCVNAEGNWAKVKPLKYGKQWDFDVFLDVNGNMKRYLGISNIPYTILLDKEQSVKCRYSGYCSGDEVQLCQKIEQCLKSSGSLTGFK